MALSRESELVEEDEEGEEEHDANSTHWTWREEGLSNYSEGSTHMTNGAFRWSHQHVTGSPFSVTQSVVPIFTASISERLYTLQTS